MSCRVSSWWFCTDKDTPRHSSHVLEGLTQVEFCASRSGIIHVVKCVYLHDSPNEIQTPTRHILVGRRMTAPPPLLSPSSILPPPSQWALIPVQKNSARLAKVFFSLFYFFRKLLSLKLRKSGSVYCQGCSHSGRKFFSSKSIRTASGAILFFKTCGIVSRGKAAGSGKWPFASS